MQVLNRRVLLYSPVIREGNLQRTLGKRVAFCHQKCAICIFEYRNKTLPVQEDNYTLIHNKWPEVQELLQPVKLQSCRLFVCPQQCKFFLAMPELP